MIAHNSFIFNKLLVFIVVVVCFCDVKDQDKSGNAQPIESIAEIELNAEVEIIGLLYHRFGELKYPSTNISPELFREQLAYLKAQNIPVIPLSMAIEKLRSKNASGRFVVITIDDAFQSFLRNGFPILDEFGFEATLFINTETVGSGDYLGWDALNYLKDNGIEIGNHTHSHDYFLDLSENSRQDAFVDDTRLAQKIIKEKLDLDPEIFAYPFGEYDNHMKESLKELGFSCAAAQNSGVISYYSDLFALPRFPMTDLYGKMTVFTEKINMKALPVKKTIPNSSITSENPPVLEIHLEAHKLRFDQMQCFIQGGDCEILNMSTEPISFQIVSSKKLTSRRHLYTITIPDNDNNWYWFSHQWVFPNIK
jgi:peptidoglycan/xylan/chitin deacetylase (PgdA/CDA1 family)